MAVPSHTQEEAARRDGEITRLSGQLSAGPDVDTLAWQYRNEANEAVILQLNQQVGLLGGHDGRAARRSACGVAPPRSGSSRALWVC